MADTGTLHDAFIDELRDTYDAERQLTKALPKLAKAASSPELRDAFESHLEETRGQIERLETVFEMPRREGARQALRRHRRHHRGRQVDHGGGLRRDHDGRVPDRGGPARRALRDGRLRDAGRLGPRDGAHRGGRHCCRKRSTRRRPPTRSCRRWPKARINQQAADSAGEDKSDDEEAAPAKSARAAAPAKKPKARGRAR